MFVVKKNFKNFAACVMANVLVSGRSGCILVMWTVVLCLSIASWKPSGILLGVNPNVVLKLSVSIKFRSTSQRERSPSRKNCANVGLEAKNDALVSVGLYFGLYGNIEPSTVGTLMSFKVAKFLNLILCSVF